MICTRVILEVDWDHFFFFGLGLVVWSVPELDGQISHQPNQTCSLILLVWTKGKKIKHCCISVLVQFLFTLAFYNESRGVDMKLFRQTGQFAFTLQNKPHQNLPIDAGRDPPFQVTLVWLICTTVWPFTPAQFALTKANRFGVSCILVM